MIYNYGMRSRFLLILRFTCYFFSVSPLIFYFSIINMFVIYSIPFIYLFIDSIP
ncbi:hypothetical protein BJ944DRAFT_271781, partial [Cunninghamella echinulata]